MSSEALSSIRTSLARWKSVDLHHSAQVLPLGISALDAALPGGGLALGGVTELQVRGASGIATSFALAACRAAQQFGRAPHGGHQRTHSSQSSPLRGVQPVNSAQPESAVWCAFIDPSASLFAPGITRLGVDLSHLLVTRPSVDAIERVAVRIAEANLMTVLVIDLRCLLLPGATQFNQTSSNSKPSLSKPFNSKPSLSLNEHSWQRTVRRLSLAIKSSFSSVLLLTQSEQFQSLPLPTSQRLELTRRSQTSFELKVAKERTGHVSPARLLPCSLFDLDHFDPGVFASRTAHDVHGFGHALVGSRDVNDTEPHWGSELTALTRKVS